MRRLLYVPIIHDQADLGSAGAALTQETSSLSGQGRWLIHKETVSQFWERVATYLRSLDLSRVKVYQDGLAAEGDVGRRIVEEAAKRGSKNYQLVLELLHAGAEVRKTEDPGLLLQEHRNIVGALGRSVGEGQRELQRHRSERSHLLAERDRFIAETVNSTLKDAELGVLFIGANHDVAPLLAGDISVETFKDPRYVRFYFEELLLNRDDARLEELREYLTAPIRVYPSSTTSAHEKGQCC